LSLGNILGTDEPLSIDRDRSREALLSTELNLSTELLLLMVLGSATGGLLRE
jgi:hypothetical protein